MLFMFSAPLACNRQAVVPMHVVDWSLALNCSPYTCMSSTDSWGSFCVSCHSAVLRNLDFSARSLSYKYEMPLDSYRTGCSTAHLYNIYIIVDKKGFKVSGMS